MDDKPKERRITFSGYAYSDHKRCLVGSDGTAARLRAKSLAVFLYLAKHADKVVAREEILTAVWPDVVVTEDSLAQCVAEIRRAITDSDRTVLRTISRQGYMLVGDRGQSPCSIEEVTVSEANRVQLQGERRQLTVMFYELAGATDLARRLDPEDLAEVIGDYQQAASKVIQEFDGYIAQFMGDGLLVYFGYPQAHEDDAQRAVFAAIGISRELKALNLRVQADHATNLSLRIGIHTGQVVVGKMGREERHQSLAVGETVNLATQLRALAKPGMVVVSEHTRRLLGGLFAVVPVGTQNAGGNTAIVNAYAVSGERVAEIRYAAGKLDGLAPMIGRQQELALLLDRWRQTTAGEGQMVVLSGEAGIGKSRIMAALTEVVAPENHLRIAYQCSPHHTDSPLYPAIQHLIYAAGLLAGDSPSTKLDKLESLLRPGQDDISDETSLLAALLDLSKIAEKRYGPLRSSSTQRREKTLQLLLTQLINAAGKRPVLFVLEDAHWIDPTTLELVERLLDRVGEHRLMLLITARPTFDYGFGNHQSMSRLSLNKLGRESITGIVERIVKGKTLQPELLEKIAAASDGVPLHAEEFTKALIESGRLSETSQGYTLDGYTEQLIIPSSLQDSLMARLDRMQAIKEIAQLAACIGREFSYALLAGIANLPESELVAALNQLVSAELIFKRSGLPEATYAFKHALVRDAAYESLLNSRRQVIHDGLLSLLEPQGDVEPEILAYHATQAGQALLATSYWEKAGDASFDRSAFKEATVQFVRAIECLQLIAKSTETQLRELDLRVKLSHVAMARHGFSHPETVAANANARALLDVAGDTPRRFPVLYNTWVFLNATSRHDDALRDAVSMCEEAEQSDNRVQKLVAYRVRGTSQLMAGKFRAAILSFDQAQRHHDANQDARLAWQYGHDPLDALELYGALALLCCGEAEMVRARIVNVEDRARERGHASAYCYVLTFLAMIEQVLGLKSARRFSDLLIKVADRYDLKFYKGNGLIFAGLVRDAEGEHRESVEEIAAGMQLIHDSAATVFVAYFEASRAQGLRLLGRTDDACRAELNAIRMINLGSEQIFAAEVYRMKAEADYWHRGLAGDAIEGLHQAIIIAKEQNAKLWELRASVSLARIWDDQGKRGAGLELLTPLVESFPVGGRDLADIASARALFRKLA